MIKPTIGSSSGHGVKILNIINGKDVKSNITIENIIAGYKTNYIIQEKIKQHPKIDYLYSNAINTIRIITYILDGEVFHTPITLRIGAGGSEVDNIHSGGLAITVSTEGKLHTHAYQLGYGNSARKFNNHPDTDVLFEGYEIPFMSEMINMSYKLHGLTPHMGVISWDFTVNNNNEILLIEANLLRQSSWFPQMLSGESFFGENVEKVLKQLSSK